MIRAAVLGSPVAHSLSPLLHNRAYRELGITGTYTALDVTEADFPKFILQAKSDDWRGFSLTMPLKESVFDLTNDIEPDAQQINSANLLLFGSDRAMSACSTDITGFAELIRDENISHDDTVTIVGAGGTARAALKALDGKVSTIQVVSRTAAREHQLRSCITKSNLSLVPWTHIKQVIAARMVINTTPVETTEFLSQTIHENSHKISDEMVLLDAVYAPRPRQTLVTWLGAGGRVIDGTELLIAQAIPQIAMMTGKRFDHDGMRHVLRSAIASTIHKESAR